MANGRNQGRKGDSGRDSGGFVALPWAVLDCPAYAVLSHPARSLLMEIARQCSQDNNGRLLASSAYLSKRGWNSKDVIARAKRELIEGGFIFETVKGHRPNKASWHAVTWRALDRLPGYDAGAAAAFERGAYRKPTSTNPKMDSAPAIKNASIRPSHGLEGGSIGPSHGLEGQSSSPSHGPMRGNFEPPPRPSHGHL